MTASAVPEPVFWIDGQPAPAPPLAASRDADVAVIGGGYTGLATALRLRQRWPGLSVVLLEARRCGAGASSRNAGMALSGCGADLDVLERRLGTAGARHALALLGRGLGHLQALTQKHGIDAGLERTGSISLARTERQARAQRGLLRVYDRLGVDAEWLEGPALRREIDAPRHVAALHVPATSALVHPHRVLTGLRQAAIESGVQVHEDTPVQAVQEGPDLKLACPGGTVRAGRMVLATNAYSPRLGYFRNRVAPVHVSCVVTAQLDANARAALGWSRRQAIWEEGRLYHFLRLTPDQRLLIGGGGAAYMMGDGLDHHGALEAYRRLERAIPAIFPQLGEVEVTHRWSGPVGFTRDFLPSFGVAGAHRNILYAVGYSGHGVALAHFAAEVLCDLASGESTEATGMFLVGRPLPWLLCDPFKWLAIHAVKNGWMALDRMGL